jgi:hypothetical protein
MKSGRKLKEADKKIIASSQFWKCKICENMLISSYQIDHIIPFSISQDDSYNNLQALCANCHSYKSQKENNRILSFKKLSALLKKNLCWFCTNELFDEFHICDKTLKDILLPKNKTQIVDKDINHLDKYIYTEKQQEKNQIISLTKCFKKLSINTNNTSTLKIKLLPTIIFVNDYHTDFINHQDYTVEKICEAINTATKDSNLLYTEVEIDLSNMNPYGEKHIPEELIDHIDTYLHQALPTNLFNSDTDIEYTFIT